MCILENENVSMNSFYTKCFRILERTFTSFEDVLVSLLVKFEASIRRLLGIGILQSDSQCLNNYIHIYIRCTLYSFYTNVIII